MSTPTTLKQLTTTQYSVLLERDSESLEIAVAKQLKEGWELQGGVSMATMPEKDCYAGCVLVFAQAMTLAEFMPIK